MVEQRLSVVLSNGLYSVHFILRYPIIIIVSCPEEEPDWDSCSLWMKKNTFGDSLFVLRLTRQQDWCWAYPEKRHTEQFWGRKELLYRTLHRKLSPSLEGPGARRELPVQSQDPMFECLSWAWRLLLHLRKLKKEDEEKPDKREERESLCEFHEKKEDAIGHHFCFRCLHSSKPLLPFFFHTCSSSNDEEGRFWPPNCVVCSHFNLIKRVRIQGVNLKVKEIQFLSDDVLPSVSNSMPTGFFPQCL